METASKEKIYTRALLVTAISAASGMLSCGWNSGCINSAEKPLKKFISDVYFERRGHQPLSSHSVTILWSIVVSIFPFGGIFGGYFAGRLSNKFGRKSGLLLTNLIGISAAVLMSISKFISSPECLILGRLVVGIECGLYTGLCSMYLAEISPKKIRGRIGTLTSFISFTGLLLGELFSTPILFGTDQLWPFIMLTAIFPAAIQFTMLSLFCSESPRYLLIIRNQESQAKTVVMKLRQKFDVNDEIDEMKQEAENLSSQKIVNIKELIINPIYRLSLSVAVVVHLSMRWCGINGIMYYSTPLFEKANIGEKSSYATTGVGVILVIMTGVSGYLMDKAGRRTLHLLGLSG
ncbi:unnamed protein product, partial [Didymodactylos carnosus]